MDADHSFRELPAGSARSRDVSKDLDAHHGVDLRTYLDDIARRDCELLATLL